MVHRNVGFYFLVTPVQIFKVEKTRLRINIF